MTFNVIDIALIVVVLLSVCGGYLRGFILGSLDLAGWILSLLAGLRFYQPVARWLASYVGQPWTKPLAFILVAVAVRVAVYLLGRILLPSLPKDIHQSRLNRWLGTIPGLANGLITAAILAALLLVFPLNDAWRERARASTTVNRLAVYTERQIGRAHV